MSIREACLGSVLFLVSLSLSLIGAEIVVRVAHQETAVKSERDKLYCYDAYYGWEYCKNVAGRVVRKDYSHVVRTGDNGQRDFGDIEKGKNNIVVLGDSFTSNIGIENTSDVFTEVLEKMLRNYNVINLGVNGYGTTQEYLRLKRLGFEYNPDIVILMFYVRNDFFDNVGLHDWIKGYERPLFVRSEGELTLTNIPVPKKPDSVQKSPASPDTKSKSIIQMLVRHSRLVALIRKELPQTRPGQWIRQKFRSQDNEQLKRQKFSKMPPEVLLVSEDDGIKEAYVITCDILAMISTELRQKEVEFYVFVIPTIFQVRNDYFQKIKRFGMSQTDRFKPNELLHKCGDEKEVNVLDLAPYLVEAENNYAQPYLYYPNEHHWTIAGNRMVASFIYDKLKETSTVIRQNTVERSK
jgi:lysophospholipase L1-like esterase